MAEDKWIKQEGTGIWIPTEEGDEIEGEVTAIEVGDYGKTYSIKAGDEEYRTPSHKMLQSRMTKAKVGTNLKIVFLGTELPTQKGYSPTRLYDVFFKE